MRWTTSDGASVVVETDEDLDRLQDLELIARGDKAIVDAPQRLDKALEDAGIAIQAVLATVRSWAPDSYSIELGLKLSAEAGVVVAKTSVEGHIVVKLDWTKPTAEND